jgi:VCBS repeat-containing protein
MKAGRGWWAGRRGVSSSQQTWRCRVEPLEERRLLDAAPVAQADLYNAVAGATLSVAGTGVLTNDSDPDGDVMSVVLTRLPTHGGVALSPQGGFQYLADPTFSGRDSFEYRVLAAGVLSAPATVSVDVTGLANAPIEWPVSSGGNGHFYSYVSANLTWEQARQAAESQSYRGAVGHLATLTSASENDWVRANIATGFGWLGGYQDLKAAEYQEPSGAWRWITGEPWSFTDWAPAEPNNSNPGSGGENHLQLFPAYDGWNDAVGSGVGRYYLEFDSPPAATFAADDTYVTLVGQAKNADATTGVAANDSLGAGAVASLVAGPSHGTLTLQPNGAFSYQPQAGYQGRDSFRYKLTVNGVDSNVATVWLKVGANDYPTVARPDTYRMLEDGHLVVAGAAGSPDYAEDFSGNALPAWLEGTGFTVSGGTIGRTSASNGNDRQYVRTVRGDYLAQDFVAEISFTTSITPGDSLMYFGLGQGQFVQGEGHHEAVNSVYFRIHTPNTSGGFVGFANARVSDAAILGNITESGLHRARIEKVGQQLTVQIDANYTGTFVPDMSYVVNDLATFAPFLDGQNTHIFFGTALTNDRFDDLSISLLPRQGVLANDSDGDGALRAELVSGPTLGQLELHADGTFSYQPQPNFSGVEEFTYRATDGVSSATTTVRIEVAAVNDPPAANRDLYTWAGGPLTIAAAAGVLANDGDPDSDLLKASLVQAPAHGTLALAADGSFVYTPGPSFTGLDSFSYRASDGTLATEPVFALLTKAAPGQKPIAIDNVYTSRQHGTLAVGAAQGLLANDFDAQGDALSVVLGRLPEHGRLTLAADGSFQYVPDVTFTGRDSFVYRAVGGGQESELATAWIDVTAGNAFEGDVKQWPIAGGGNGHAYVLLNETLTWEQARDRAASLIYKGAAGHLVTITSLAELEWLYQQFGGTDAWLGAYQDPTSPNYSEPNGGWQWVTGEPWGFTNWISGEPNDVGGENYVQHLPGWNDLAGGNQLQGLFVEFSDFPPPPPGAADDAFSAGAGATITRLASDGVLANDHLPAGSTAVLVTGPQHGGVSLAPDGGFVYTPQAGYAGRDFFTYKAQSPSGESNVATAWIKLGTNEFAPTARPDAYRVAEDGQLVAGSTAPSADLMEDFSGAAFDARLEGEGFKLAGGVISRAGTPQVNDRQYVRTVAGDYLGKDFTYEISFTTSFWPNINNDLPRQSMIIGLGSAEIQQGFGLHEPVNSMFLRIGTPSTDGGAITLSNGPLTSVATLGAISANGLHRVRIEKVGNQATFSVDAFYDGSFQADYTYVVTDLAAVAPFLTGENTRLFFGTAHREDYFDDLSIVVQPWRGVLGNDTDADQQTLTAQLVQGPAHGVLNLSPNGAFTYKPAANFSGVDSFTYRASDGQLNSPPTTVTIVVDPTPDPTTAVDDAYQVDENGELRVDPALQSVRSLQLNARDLVYDEVGGLFWASVPNNDIPSAGAVVSIDPQTGQVSAPIVVGDRPSALAVSADGQYLYIGLDGSSTVRRLHIPTRTPGPAASLGDGNRARDLEVSPSDPNTFVVALNQGDWLNPSGVAFYTNMVRSYLREGWLITDIDYNDDGTAVVGYWKELSSRPVHVLTAPPNVQELVSREYFIPGNPSGEIVWQRDRIYFTESNQVLEPTKLNYQGTLPSGAVRPDDSLSRIFVLSGNTIRVIDETSLERISQIAVPQAPGEGNSGLLRFGSSGLAFRNGDSIFFVQSDLIGGDPRPRGVLLNDQDADGTTRGATLVSNVEHGALTLNSDGSFTYKPTLGYTGPDQFTYRVVDAAGQSNVATVKLTVRPINDPPVAANESYATSQVGKVQATAAKGVLANDTDPEGDLLSAALVAGPANGTLVLNADGSFVYTPAAGFTGQDQFTYRATDGLLQSNLATVTIQVRPATIDLALRAVANPSAADTAAALPNSLAAIDVGSEYFVEVWVQDVGVAPAGIPGGQIDLDYDTALSDALGLNHGGLYNLIPTGSIDEAGGLINDFGGGTITPAAAGAPQWARLGYVRVSASAHGLASYQLGPGALQFSRVGGGSVAWDKVDVSETLLVDHQAKAELEVRVVAQPTAVDGAGEVDALPSSLPWVDEWSGYWVEVWVRSTDEGAGQGISQAAANLLYDTRYGTAREIQYGPAFTTGKTGTIDDANGRVTNLGAATTRSDVGDDRFALLARVRYAPGASDQAPLDEVGHFAGPYDLALGLSDPAVRLVGAAANGATDLRTASLPIYAALYDIDDNDQIDYGDLSYFAAAFGKIDAGAMEPPYVWWANFDRQGAVDFGDFSFLAANFGRTKAQGGLEYPANYPAAWGTLSAGALSPGALDAAGFDPPAKPLGGDDLGMTVRLVARATPGAGDSAATLPAGLTQVAVGGNYTIEVWVQDTAGLGVTGGLVDIGYPQGRVDGQSLEHGGVYTTFTHGTLREANGRADDLGGGSVAPALGSSPQWVRLGYFTFEVTGPGPLEFKLSPGQLQFSRYGAGNVAWDKVELGSLTLNPALLGDVNSDGKVNLTDFGIFKNNFGTGDTWAKGDLDGNGRVDLSDFGLLKANFGRTQAALLAVVPPPRAAAMAQEDERNHAVAVDLAFAAEEESEEDEPWLDRLV